MTSQPAPGLHPDVVRRAQAVIDLTGRQGDTSVTRAVAIELLEEVKRVRQLINRDRTGLAATIAKMVKSASSRLWVTEGRGSYEWDDDRYRDEAGQALREVIEIGKLGLHESGQRADVAFRPPQTKPGELPPSHFRAVASALLKHAFAEYQRWQDGTGDARTFVGWVKDEMTCPHDRTLSCCDECNPPGSAPRR